MTRQERHATLRYFAVVRKYRKERWGYVMDYYPNEKLRYQRELGKTIVGDFASAEDAYAAVKKSLVA